MLKHAVKNIEYLLNVLVEIGLVFISDEVDKDAVFLLVAKLFHPSLHACRVLVECNKAVGQTLDAVIDGVDWQQSFAERRLVDWWHHVENVVLLAFRVQ